MGKSSINGLFSMAMLNNQRVKTSILPNCPHPNSSKLNPFQALKGAQSIPSEERRTSQLDVIVSHVLLIHKSC